MQEKLLQNAKVVPNSDISENQSYLTSSFVTQCVEIQDLCKIPIDHAFSVNNVHIKIYADVM